MLARLRRKNEIISKMTKGIIIVGEDESLHEESLPS
jgi:hypothetical protein